MKTIAFTLSLTAGLFVSGLAAAQSPSPDLAFEVIEGHYQAILGDCAACHTKPGGEPFAGGAPLATPFGTLVPPNITPDKETGIGNWSYDDFRKAMKTGIGHDGKRLYPAMPYPAYAKMPDKDIAHLWAYLQTVTPVHNQVEANQLPFPFNIRALMMGWNLLNFSPKPFAPDPTQSAEWNRGAYLVEGPGHCGTCHTEKTLLGADKTSVALEGASLQGWYAPNITGNPYLGIGSWSEADLVTYLKTGVNSHSIASGPMAEAIEASTSQMKDDDLKAIAVYLKSLKGGDTEKPQPLDASDARMKIGAAVYHDTCMACHGGNGQGASQLFPALAENPIVQQKSAESLIRVVLHGSQGVATATRPTTPAMPSLSWRLSDEQTADVLTYIRNSWGNAAEPVKPADVKQQR
ncbi:cytochrome c [Allorhizobium sp. BGMRC 0089]|uniref:c-type cytochrome n=1 Tax=Allorhizobium sonneratiae TaxID=2934936 RepID=UPI0020340212|nr:cytochrome c [Allorhizobium sonneratiae]MCM2293147.1 cytochrome c [Allorhizobium sonneratiae]